MIGYRLYRKGYRLVSADTREERGPGEIREDRTTGRAYAARKRYPGECRLVIVGNLEILYVLESDSREGIDEGGSGVGQLDINIRGKCGDGISVTVRGRDFRRLSADNIKSGRIGNRRRFTCGYGSWIRVASEG